MQKNINYQEINSKTIDRWVDEGWEWGKPVTRSECEKARRGEWNVLLTPTKPVPHDWFPPMKGLKILGLASGGGQQMPIFSLLGAECTVLDYSDRQLESERAVAEREGYGIRIVKADMTKPLPFDDGEFDLVFNPVSFVYVRELDGIFKECARVLKPKGVLMCGLDNGVNFMTSDEEHIDCKFPFDPTVDSEQMRMLEAEDCGVQFSHSIGENIGGQLRAGFVLTDVYDDTNGEGRLHEMNIPSFFATRSVKG